MMNTGQIRVGLRVDVDTFRGTRQGVPRIMHTLSQRNIHATFFFSVGPDNMGRNLWRLLRPAFLYKCLRTHAPNLYGWDILLAGTCWPGKLIAQNNVTIIKSCASAGHEIGLHCWDHYTSQNHIATMKNDTFRRRFTKAYSTLTKIIGTPPTCSGVPAWRCTDDVLRIKDEFGFRFCSDLCGKQVFLPEVGGETLHTPQIPLTLPTFDEMVGNNGITPSNYNEALFSLLRPNALNVLAVHAEVEGGIYSDLFDSFLSTALERGVTFTPLGNLLPEEGTPLMSSPVIKRPVQGRDGWVSHQAEVKG